VDSFIGLDGSDVLNADDNVADAILDCDGGGSPGAADRAEIDAVIDAAPSGCETINQH